MSFQFNGIPSAEVTITGSQVLKTASWNRSASGTATVFTTTAGKTAKIVGWDWTTWTATSHINNLKINGTTVWSQQVANTNITGGEIMFPLGSYLEVPATQIFAIDLSANGYCSGNVYYYEV